MPTLNALLPLAPDEAGSTTYGQLTIVQPGSEMSAVSLQAEWCLNLSGQPTGLAGSSLKLELDAASTQRFVEQWCGDDLRRIIYQTMQLAERRYWEEVAQKLRQLNAASADYDRERQKLFDCHQARVATALTLVGAQDLYAALQRFLAAPPAK